MKGLKFFFYVLVCMALANCKVTFEDDVLTVDDEDEQEESYYVGDVEEINYFDGGGLTVGGVPNYKIKLDLHVNSKGSVSADLDTYYCKVSDKISGKTFGKLVKLIENAETTGEKASYDATAMDGSVGKLTVHGKDFEEKLYIYGGTPLLAKEDGKKILTALESIAAELKEKGCDGDFENNIAVLYYHENLISVANRPQDLINTTADQALVCNEFSGCGTRSTTRQFRLSIEKGKVRVTGQEIRPISNGACYKNLKDKVIDVDLIADINKIEVRQQANICLIAAPAGMGLELILVDQDGNSEKGGEGCWHNRRLSKHEDFKNKFLKWLAKQPEDCAVGHF